MSAITSSAIRVARIASNASLRTAVSRQYSSAIATEISAPAAPAAQHSTKKVAIASGAAFIAGVDATYAYFTLQKKDSTA
ncbi:hypothetical protein FBU30_004380 [Linnemannia zychae]|nr:hypothetical protein FBU30_004380 [Linnemannia zychae]